MIALALRSSATSWSPWAGEDRTRERLWTGATPESTLSASLRSPRSRRAASRQSRGKYHAGEEGVAGLDVHEGRLPPRGCGGQKAAECDRIVTALRTVDADDQRGRS